MFLRYLVKQLPGEHGELDRDVEPHPDRLGHGLAGLVKPVLGPEEGQHQLLLQLPEMFVKKCICFISHRYRQLTPSSPPPCSSFSNPQTLLYNADPDTRT